MRKAAKRPCPICVEDGVFVLHRQRAAIPEGCPLQGEYDVVACPSCGFVYADTEDTQDRYDRYYAERSKYADPALSSGAGVSPWDQARLRETARFLATHLPDRRAHVADLGCANGGLLRCLRDLGYARLVGIDPSPHCARQTAQALGIQTHAATVLASAGLGPFDCVILSHVLEHMRDLDGAIRVVRAATDAGGLVYVEVPDASRYCEHVVAPFQEFNLEHINHFSHGSLHNLMRRGGFQPVAREAREIESSPGNPYPVIASLWRLGGGDGESTFLEPDEKLKERMERYIRTSELLMAEINARLQDLRRTHPRIIVWGVGQLALHLLADSGLRDFDVAAFVDGNPVLHGERIAGIPIRAPRMVRDLPFPILITSLLHEAEIARAIREQYDLGNILLSLRADR